MESRESALESRLPFHMAANLQPQSTLHRLQSAPSTLSVPTSPSRKYLALNVGDGQVQFDVHWSAVCYAKTAGANLQSTPLWSGLVRILQRSSIPRCLTTSPSFRSWHSGHTSASSLELHTIAKRSISCQIGSADEAGSITRQEYNG